MPRFNIEHRKSREVNTDPQRRCYNGCHFSSKLVWSRWEWLELDLSEEKARKRLVGWQELNDYAVASRGESARKEFRLVQREGMPTD